MQDPVPQATPMAERHALVVDDSRSACFAMRKYLEHYNYFVSTALNASEAYGYLRTHTPRVIFLDQLMPGITGLEMLRTLKTNPETVAIPVVMFTSIELTSFKVEAREYGAIEVLNKPPNLDLLEKLLADIDVKANPQTPHSVPVAETTPLAEPISATQQPAPTLAILLPEPATNYTALRDEINLGLHHLTEDIFVQISELKAQVKQVEAGQLTGNDRDAFRKIAREEADSLYQSVKQELDTIRRKLDTLDLMQRTNHHELLREAHMEVGTAAEQAVAEAVNRFSHRLTDAILKALGKH